MAIIVYNWTEAAFKNVSPTWFVFYIIALDYPMAQLAPRIRLLIQEIRWKMGN